MWQEHRNSQWSVTQGHQPQQEHTLEREADETKTRRNSSGDDSRRLDGSPEIHTSQVCQGYTVKAVVMRHSPTVNATELGQEYAQDFLKSTVTGIY